MNLWLDPIPSFLEARAVEAVEAGDALGFLCKASNEDWLDLVWRNRMALQVRGIYEKALVEAFIGTRTNNLHWPASRLAFLFRIADRARLRATGDPIPGTGLYTLYRGVAGIGRARRVKGFSWTASQDQARWFAARFAGILPDPAVFRVSVAKRHVLFYSNARQEAEYIVLLPETAKPVLVERVVVEQDAPAGAGNTPGAWPTTPSPAKESRA
jgi:hypothetical protein